MSSSNKYNPNLTQKVSSLRCQVGVYLKWTLPKDIYDEDEWPQTALKDANGAGIILFQSWETFLLVEHSSGYGSGSP